MIRPVDIALTYEGVREVGGKNRGPEIDRFLRMVGKPPGLAWCAAFVCTCTYEAYAENYQLAGNAGPFDPKLLPIPMTAGAWLLLKVGLRRGLGCKPKPGAIFIIDHGIDVRTGLHKAHAGFVVDVHGQRLDTFEGNTSVAGSREGDGCYSRPDSRAIKHIAGFLDVNPKEEFSGQV